ncbi:MAG: hypothetical protein C5B59_04900 [Bacteroidetes bacterium]|nr:MAG: hypothetical protein C5B59_04900 [Bacteroidota bacterium]
MNRPPKFFKTVTLAGLLVGTMDISAAIIQFLIQTGRSPARIFWFIASGILGRSAYTGGALTAIFGLALHYLIAFCFTFLFFLLYPRLAFLSKSIVVSGILYGAFIWVIMNLIVVPLSNAQKFGFSLTQSLIAAGILIVAIGIPLSIIAKRYYSHN